LRETHGGEKWGQKLIWQRIKAISFLCTGYYALSLSTVTYERNRWAYWGVLFLFFFPFFQTKNGLQMTPPPQFLAPFGNHTLTTGRRIWKKKKWVVTCHQCWPVLYPPVPKNKLEWFWFQFQFHTNWNQTHVWFFKK